MVNRLADRLACALRENARFSVSLGEAVYGTEKILLVKPSTFMNASGTAVAPLLRYRNLAVTDLIAVSDDADLPLGRLRIRSQGSSGGHRGLESVIQELGSADFVRIRVGVGRSSRPGRDLAEYVLAPLSAEDRSLLERALDRAAEAALCVVESGVDVAMNRFNRPDAGPAETESGSGICTKG